MTGDVGAFIYTAEVQRNYAGANTYGGGGGDERRRFWRAFGLPLGREVFLCAWN